MGGGHPHAGQGGQQGEPRDRPRSPADAPLPYQARHTTATTCSNGYKDGGWGRGTGEGGRGQGGRVGHHNRLFFSRSCFSLPPFASPMHVPACGTSDALTAVTGARSQMGMRAQLRCAVSEGGGGGYGETWRGRPPPCERQKNKGGQDQTKHKTGNHEGAPPPLPCQPASTQFQNI